MIGVGLLYRKATSSSGVDRTGCSTSTGRRSSRSDLPAVQVLAEDGTRASASTCPLAGGEIAFHVWRVDVGRVPLYLLDTEPAREPPRRPLDHGPPLRGQPRSRGSRSTALLGIGGVRALRGARASSPSVLHFNEGHAGARGPRARARTTWPGRASLEDALARARARSSSPPTRRCPRATRRTSPTSLRDAFADLRRRLGIDDERFLDLCRTRPGTDESAGDDAARPPPHPPRERGRRRHGEVARAMWRPLSADRAGRRRARSAT